MRALLYNTRNGLFLQPDQTWTGDSQSALDFGGTVTAVTVAFKQRFLKDTAVVLSFEDSNLNMVLPLERGCE